MEEERSIDTHTLESSGYLQSHKPQNHSTTKSRCSELPPACLSTNHQGQTLKVPTGSAATAPGVRLHSNCLLRIPVNLGQETPGETWFA